MAYSDRINDAAIKKHRAYSRTVRIILFVLLSVAAGAAAFISKTVGAGTAAAITVAAIAVFGFLTKPWLAFEKDWEGEVVSKEKEYTYSKSVKMLLNNPQRKQATDKQGNVIPYVKSILKIKKDDGREYVYTGVDDDELPEVCYYRIGDRVHHHAGLKLCEKEDKSKDRAVLCLRCLTLTPKSEDKCNKCGLTLLK